MLATILTLGMLLGAGIGTVHAFGVYRSHIRDGARASRGRAAYSAAWTLVLWTLFGSYVLVLWLIAVPLWTGHRVLGRT